MQAKLGTKSSCIHQLQSHDKNEISLTRKPNPSCYFDLEIRRRWRQPHRQLPGAPYKTAIQPNHSLLMT